MLIFGRGVGVSRHGGTGSRLHISVRYQCICAQHIGSNRGTANMQCSWVYKLDDVDQSVSPYSCNFLGTGRL